MTQPIHLPHRHPVKRASDYWALLRASIPPDLIDPACWERLAPAASMLPSPAFLVERTLDSPRLIQFGCHLWPWRWAAALASAAEFPAAAFLAPPTRALQSLPATAPYLHLMAMWDAETGDGSLRPQLFLAFMPGEGHWRDAVRAFADRLDPADFADTWRRCADTPHANVVALGVYPGRGDAPVRVTVTTTAQREWADHPNWAAVDEMVRLAGVAPAIAVAPTPDPGPVWHVPMIASRKARPHEALAPVVDALRERGLADSDTARLLRQAPWTIPVPEAAILDGRPALLRLMVSLERLKVVVENGEWVSAKACYMVRLVWRGTGGRVLVED